MFRSAVMCELGVIGEAANTLSDKFKTERPEIPWRSIADLRNVLTHHYWDTVWALIEQTLDDDLGLLRRSIVGSGDHLDPVVRGKPGRVAAGLEAHRHDVEARGHRRHRPDLRTGEQRAGDEWDAAGRAGASLRRPPPPVVVAVADAGHGWLLSDDLPKVDVVMRQSHGRAHLAAWGITTEAKEGTQTASWRTCEAITETATSLAQDHHPESRLVRAFTPEMGGHPACTSDRISPITGPLSPGFP